MQERAPRDRSGQLCPSQRKDFLDFAHLGTAVFQARIQKAGSSAMKARASSRSKPPRRTPPVPSSSAATTGPRFAGRRRGAPPQLGGEWSTSCDSCTRVIFRLPGGERRKGAPMLLVDVVDMFGATRVGTAIRYLITELERIRRREHVVGMPMVSLPATWMPGTGRYVFDVVDIQKPARGNSIKSLTLPAAGRKGLKRFDTHEM